MYTYFQGWTLPGMLRYVGVEHFIVKRSVIIPKELLEERTKQETKGQEEAISCETHKSLEGFQKGQKQRKDLQ